MRLVVISGRSGAGKSTALHVLEDAGFNCVDNLPTSLLPNLVDKLEANGTHEAFAVSIDARNTWEELQRFPEIIQQAKRPGLRCDILYLDAHTDILIRRFSETRRRHPLSDEDTDLSAAIQLERTYLTPIVDSADLSIDTSNLNLHQLRDLVKQRLVDQSSPDLALQFISFGFKHGVPVDADLVFDARCLPNPYWKQELRAQTGKDSGVIAFLESDEMVEEMFRDIQGYLSHWLPRFVDNNRSYFTVAIGCTGGQHRSVYLSERLKRYFCQTFDNTQVRHRELTEKQ